MILSVIAIAFLVSPQEGSLVSLDPTTIEGRGVAYEADVGRLRVPQNRSKKGSTKIELEFVRLLSTAEDPGPALFFLPGGPGNAAIPMAPSPVWARFLELGDVVLMDPRGVGRSQPDLEWTSKTLRSELFFADRKTAVGHMAEVCTLATKELAAKDVDITGLTTIEMADDVDALRRALEYERVNLLGHSYGTLLGLSILRRHPGTVARFVSVGTAGPGDMMKLPSDLDKSLRELSEIVAADPVVGEGMPDLFAEFESVVAELAQEPLPVILSDPRTHEPMEVLLGEFGLRLLVVADLGDTSDLPVLPRLIRSLQSRDPSVVRWFLQKRVNQFASLPLVMLAVRGAQGATSERWERIRHEAKASPFGLARCLFSPESDRALGVLDVGDAFRASVQSDVPTLLVSGTLDGATPPFQAERVLAGLSQSGHVVVEYGGHEDLLPDPRVQDLILTFLAGADPEDAFLEREPLRFAPLEGGPGKVKHPALTTAR